MTSISNTFNDPLKTKQNRIKLIYICPLCQTKNDIPELEEVNSFSLEVESGFELRLDCKNEECTRTGFVRCVNK